MTLDIALSLAASGWHVFPVSPTTRRPVVKWGDAATADAEQVATWWTGDHVDALVGVHCGRSGLVVVDIDEKNGKSGGQALEAAGIAPPDTFNYATRSGGRHLLYAAPDGRDLTIAQNVPVDGVDIRAGVGFIVYNGPALDKQAAQQLTAAPEWSLLDRKTQANSDDDATVTAWLERTAPGKPTKAVREAVATVTADGMDRAAMLHAVTELVKLGAERGAGDAYRQARATYLEHYPDYAREWDNAAAGSVKRLGLPPVTFDIPKPERKALKQRAKEPRSKAVDRPHRSAWNFGDEAGVAPLDDKPLASALAIYLADRWAFFRGLGLMRYDAGVWTPAESKVLGADVADLVQHLAERETLHAQQQAERAKSADDAEKEKMWKSRASKATSLLSRPRIRAIGDLLEGELMRAGAQPDMHSHLLNVQNGVVDLRSGELLEHDPALFMTKMAGTTYVPGATSKDWAQALEALPKKVREWMQVRLGQAMTGQTPDDDVVPVLIGAGSNGKSALIAGARKAAGTYATTASEKVLTADPKAHSTELTDLFGVRFAVLEELSEGGTLNSKRLKDIAGTPEMTARRMYQDSMTWQASHSMMVTTNHAPIVVETDSGTWRRLALVRFPYTFVPSKRDVRSPLDRVGDRTLRDRVKDNDDPAVLAWLVEGAMRWYAAGSGGYGKMPRAPKQVIRDTDEWRRDSDPLVTFIEENIEADRDSAIYVDDLRFELNAYLTQIGLNEWSPRLIASRLRAHSSMQNVTKGTARIGGSYSISRPTSGTGAVTMRPLRPKFEAWLGVRFRDDAVVDRGDNVTSLHRDARVEGDRRA